MTSIQELTGYSPTWCPGCGNWGIGAAIKSALISLNLSPDEVLVAFGIGCSGNMNDFLNAYAFHGLHGRAVATAIGMKLANHSLPVLAVVGDGDCYGEGGNHFLHACRGNHDITVIVHDNRVYGLTTGQVAPTADKGYISKSTPSGIIEVPLDPLSLAITQGATFVAQTFAGNMQHMMTMIQKGIEHKGFSLVNILQPCVTFNKKNTYPYYVKNSYMLEKNHNSGNKQQALELADNIHKERFPLGVLYETTRPSYHEEALDKSTTPLVHKERYTDFSSLIDSFI